MCDFYFHGLSVFSRKFVLHREEAHNFLDKLELSICGDSYIHSFFFRDGKKNKHEHSRFQEKRRDFGRTFVFR